MAPRRRPAPPTCSHCGRRGHIANVCPRDDYSGDPKSYWTITLAPVPLKWMERVLLWHMETDLKIYSKFSKKQYVRKLDIDSLGNLTLKVHLISSHLLLLREPCLQTDQYNMNRKTIFFRKTNLKFMILYYTNKILKLIQIQTCSHLVNI